ncbi:hypothetical protein G7Y89_g11927 [Cudoniella acicularis]|uniref:Uncharacterized protein n=1 Tax=Cudoniella acicularis TaxID=354080 RepID=A0A8H4VZP9_9HELO|nr:hypothetical protein G7Y89_g11927 [Cudoniella acicularis]
MARSPPGSILAPDGEYIEADSSSLENVVYLEATPHLFIRACSSKPTWSPNGECKQRSPSESSVPSWLIALIDQTKPKQGHIPDELRPAHELGLIQFVNEKGSWHIQIMEECCAKMRSKMGRDNRRQLLFEGTAIALHAFPCNHAEILGEEMAHQLLRFVVPCVLPLLAVATDDDFMTWLSPSQRRYSFLFHVLEFLHNVSVTLGMNHLALPRGLPQRLLALIQLNPELSPRDVEYSFVLVGAKNILTQAEPGTPETTRSLEFFIQHTHTPDSLDERTNAAIGLSLAMIYSNQNLVSIHQRVANLIRDWRPLPKNSPCKHPASAMEYLTAVELNTAPKLDSFSSSGSFSTDTEAMIGFIMSRRGFYDIAWEILRRCVKMVKSEHGVDSFEFGVTVAELINCCNMLRKEDIATRLAIQALASRQDPDLIGRPDWFYLSVGLADSFIGQAKYHTAVAKLEEILAAPFAPATTAMTAALRFAKVQRRLEKGGEKAFIRDSPLWKAATHFGAVSHVLKLEFLEEIGCNLSLLSQSDDGKTTTGFMDMLDEQLLKERSCLFESPSCQWYFNMRQRHNDPDEKVQLQPPQNQRKRSIDSSNSQSGEFLKDSDLATLPHQETTSGRGKVKGSTTTLVPALHSVAKNGNIRYLRILLSTKIFDINSEDSAGRTPLFWATMRGHEGIIKLLLDKGASVDSKDSAGRTPLSFAI